MHNRSTSATRESAPPTREHNMTGIKRQFNEPLAFKRDDDGDYHADENGIVYTIVKSTDAGFGLSIHGLSTAEREALKHLSRNAIYLNSISFNGAKWKSEMLANKIADEVHAHRLSPVHRAASEWLRGNILHARHQSEEIQSILRAAFVAGHTSKSVD